MPWQQSTFRHAYGIERLARRRRMKARQIAPAFTNVYAIGPIDQVRFIERDPDGFWGEWRVTHAIAQRLVNAGEIVARIGLDQRVSALQRTPPLPWHTWELQAHELAATHLPDGAPALFATDTDSTVWHTWKSTPAAPWSEWQALGGPATGIAAELIPGGGLAVFGVRDGAVYHRWQDRPFSTWNDWKAVDGLPRGVTAVQAATIRAGGLAVFVLGSDKAVYHCWQNQPFGRWQSWPALGTEIRSFSVARTSRSGHALFAIGTDDAVRYRYQPKPFGEWGPWTTLSGTARSIAAQVSYSDGLEVFAIGLDDEVYHTWCVRLDEPWTKWTRLERESPAGSG